MSAAIKFLILAIFVTVFSLPCLGYSAGAPGSQCDTMTTGHRGIEEILDSTDYVIVNQTTSNGIALYINGVGDKQFKGYLMMVRTDDVEPSQPTGVFNYVSDGQYRDCGGVAKSAVTHDDSDLKSSILAMWVAPIYGNDFVIRATVVEEYSRVHYLEKLLKI